MGTMKPDRVWDTSSARQPELGGEFQTGAARAGTLVQMLSVKPSDAKIVSKAGR